MMDSLRRGRVAAPGAGQLGEREEQVLCLIADGYSSKEIARNLQIARIRPANPILHSA